MWCPPPRRSNGVRTVLVGLCERFLAGAAPALEGAARGVREARRLVADLPRPQLERLARLSPGARGGQVCHGASRRGPRRESGEVAKSMASSVGHHRGPPFQLTQGGEPPTPHTCTWSRRKSDARFDVG